MNLKDLATEAAGYLEPLQSVRRDIHRHPELGLETPKTLDRVMASISELPSRSSARMPAPPDP